MSALQRRDCRLRAATMSLLTAVVFTGAAGAEEPIAIPVSLKDHRFMPAEIHVPSGKAVVLTVTNEDTAPEEFDSVALKVEKVIPAGQYATIRLRPMGPGRYRFMGEFHSDTAQGVVISE
jgi:heme/copper-type cytochrome/quinol oxidase subunit 2